MWFDAIGKQDWRLTGPAAIAALRQGAGGVSRLGVMNDRLACSLRSGHGMRSRLVILVAVGDRCGRRGLRGQPLPLRLSRARRGTSASLPTRSGLLSGRLRDRAAADLPAGRGFHQRGGPGSRTSSGTTAAGGNRSRPRSPRRCTRTARSPIVQMDPTDASVSKIAAGDYDSYLRSYADSVRASASRWSSASGTR